jgi:IgA Peptidase M64/Proprotein convertase P-domain
MKLDSFFARGHVRLVQNIVAGLALLVCSGAIGCGSSAPDQGARLELVVAAGRVELVSGIPIQLVAQPPSHVSAATDVRWKFLANDGMISTGYAPDPRIVDIERFDSTIVERVYRAGAGRISIEIPDVPGILRVVDDAGQLLGELRHSPLNGVETNAGDSTGDGKADIDFATDIIGNPVLAAGTGDTSASYNLLFLPEGYQHNELGKFHQDVATALAGIRSTPGYAEHWGQINAYYQDIKSADTGISDPSTGTVKDTAFNITFGDGTTLPRRCVLPSTQWDTVSVANFSRLSRAVNANAIVIIANAAEDGGCAQQRDRLIVLTNRDLGRVLPHELGHTLFGLADEYSGSGNCSGGPNVSLDLQHLPWRDLILSSTPVPTPNGAGASVVGAYEGGGYCSSGAWRPQETCLMRSLNSELCQVCRRILDTKFAERASLLTRAMVTNLANEKIWLKCDGIDQNCVNWTEVEPNATIELLMPDGRFVLSNTTHSFLTLQAPSSAFNIYPGAAPLTPPGPIVEVCGDGVDNDVDSAIDCIDTDCVSTSGCQTSTTTRTYTVSPQLAIPDNNSAGVSSTISVSDVGTIDEASVTVEIAHTYRGDLVVSLVNGNNDQIVSNKVGGATDNIRETFTLAGLAGKPLTGSWTLKIVDSAAHDIGRLEKWSLEVKTH